MVKMWSAGKVYDVSGSGFDPNVGKVYPADDVDGIPHQISGLNVHGLSSQMSRRGSGQSPNVIVSESDLQLVKASNVGGDFLEGGW